jgi:hypothetical protein
MLGRMLRGDYITGVFVVQIKQFDMMFSGTVFPPFTDPEAQANKVAQDYWDQKMSEPCGPDGPDEDPADIADDAHQKSLDFYETMTAMHHTVLNLFTAGAFHLFEQQAGTLLESWTGTRPKFPFSAFEELVKNRNGPAIDVKAAPIWPRLNELRLVSNVVKHSEGDSADKLRAVNDAYFKLPAVRGTELEKDFGGDRMLGEPLTGDGIYVTKDNYDAFVQAIVEFWTWLASVVG